MARIQQSIEIKVPVHTVYNQLIRFEAYPCFMEEVETVQQLDDTHLHWKTRMANRPVEWDAEITEQEPDRCIAWRNISGPTNAGKVEVQESGPQAARVTLTLESEPQQVPGSMAGESEAELALRLKMDMARLKDFIEARGGEAQGVHTAHEHDLQGAPAQQTVDTQQGRGSPRNAPARMSSYAAGSEGFAGDEEPSAPVASSSRTAAEQWNDAATQSGQQMNRSTQSDASLSKCAGQTQDARFSVAEEVNLDQQSDLVRHVGQMPQDTSAEGPGSMPASDAMAKSMQQERQGAQQEAKMKEAMERAVPPSEPEQPPASGASAGRTLGGTGPTAKP